MEIQYIADHAVDAVLDQQLRDLLSTCFTNPQDVVFQTRRYFNEPPLHRWFVCADDKVVAHVALHEKTIRVDDEVCPIGGIAEVCVHPDHRGQGLVGRLLQQAHAKLCDQGIPYSVLYGEPEIYGSSGYRTVDNLLVLSDRGESRGGWVSMPVMVLPLAERAWPEGLAHLDGKMF